MTKTTIKKELIEYFEDKVPLDLVKDITLSISTKIHDVYLNSSKFKLK